MISDRQIKLLRDDNKLVIEPFDPNCLQPVSYDVHLGDFALFESVSYDNNIVDIGNRDVHQHLLRYQIPTRDDTCVMTIGPKEFVLAEMKEKFVFSKYVGGRLDGKSTIGRIGLFIHVTAGVFDPGWYGRATFELYNASRRRIRLWAGMKIGQMTFYYYPEGVDREYGSRQLGSHYQGDTTVQGSRGLWGPSDETDES